MNNYQPTINDVVVDLRRCIYASFSPQGFKDPNVTTFLDHAIELLNGLMQNLDPKIFEKVEARLKKAQAETNKPKKKREDLLTASLLLQTSVNYPKRSNL